MLICLYAEVVHGQRKVGKPCSRLCGYIIIFVEVYQSISLGMCSLLKWASYRQL